MKKLLFSLVAAAACGAVTAAPVEFTGLTTFDPAKPDDGGTVSNENRIYWEIDTSTDPELTVTDKDSAALGYLQINTGSTPLWRTFSGIADPALATDANLDAAGVAADGKVVSSDVKLTACTEWPTLTDFANEKLALFLFAPEEGDTSGNTGGLYAVGGAMVDPDGEGEEVAALTRKAYKLTVTGNITNEQGWAKISIKTYGDIYKTSGADKLAGFVIAVNDKIATRAEATGFTADDLGTTAATRNTDGTLIPAAMTTTAATIAGLGFQGEGGIDNVDLAAADFAVDAVAMTVDLTDATLTDITGAKVTSLSADGNLEFDPGTQTITFKVSTADDMVVTVKLGDYELTATNGVYSFTPAADAELTVTAAPAAFQIGDAKYATLDKALAGLKSGDTLKLLGTLEVDSSISFTDADENAISEIVLDLNGQTIVAKVGFEDNLIYNVSGTKLTIIDSSVEKTGTVDGGVANEGELIINAGKFNGAVANDGTLTDNGGMFKDTTGLPEVTGKEYRDDNADSYYTLEDKVVVPDPEPETPEISDENGSIEEDEDGNYVVDTESTEITVTKLPADFTGKVVIPSTVEKIIGVALEQLKVMATVTVGETTQSFDIAGVLKIEDGKLVLDETKAKPALAEEDPFVVGDTTAVSVKTIPGLKYSLVYDSDLSFESDAKGETAAVPATTTSMTLTDDSESKPTKRFYKVKVTK